MKEKDQLKQKLNQKDAYIQNQSKKLQQLQACCDKRQLDLEANKKINQV